MKKFIEILFGSEGIEPTIAFILFTILGMLFIKLISYQKKKAANKKSSITSPLKFNLKIWLDDNLIDFILAFMGSFFFFRFFPDAFSFVDNFYELPEFSDKMAYGLLLGLLFQYLLHKIMNNVTVENTVEKIKSK